MSYAILMKEANSSSNLKYELCDFQFVKKIITSTFVRIIAELIILIYFLNDVSHVWSIIYNLYELCYMLREIISL